MTKKHLMVLLVGVIALGMVAHVVIAADEEGGRGRGRGPGAGRGKPGGEGDRPAGRPEGRPGGAEGRRRPPMHMMSPLMAALDVNKDGTLDKEEIANATAVLTKLAGDDGVLTREELRPKRPEGRAGKGGERPEGGKGRGRGEGGKGRGPKEGGKGRGPGGEGNRPE